MANNILYAGKGNFGRSQLNYRDVCKWNTKKLNIGLNEREKLIMKWRSYIQSAIKTKNIITGVDNIRRLQKEKNKNFQN